MPHPAVPALTASPTCPLPYRRTASCAPSRSTRCTAPRSACMAARCCPTSWRRTAAGRPRWTTCGSRWRPHAGGRCRHAAPEWSVCPGAGGDPPPCSPPTPTPTPTPTPPPAPPPPCPLPLAAEQPGAAGAGAGGDQPGQPHGPGAGPRQPGDAAALRQGGGRARLHWMGSVRARAVGTGGGEALLRLAKRARRVVQAARVLDCASPLLATAVPRSFARAGVAGAAGGPGALPLSSSSSSSAPCSRPLTGSRRRAWCSWRTRCTRPTSMPMASGSSRSRRRAWAPSWVCRAWSVPWGGGLPPLLAARSHARGSSLARRFLLHLCCAAGAGGDGARALRLRAFTLPSPAPSAPCAPARPPTGADGDGARVRGLRAPGLHELHLQGLLRGVRQVRRGAARRGRALPPSLPPSLPPTLRAHRRAHARPRAPSQRRVGLPPEPAGAAGTWSASTSRRA